MKPTGKTHKKAKKIKQPSEPRGCIYLITNLINDRQYVGQDQTGDPVNHRWKQHKTAALTGKSEYPLHRALRKAHKNDKCWKGFKFEIIWRGPISLLHEKETYYIKKLHTFNRDPLGNRGYNLTKGGEGCRGYKHTKSTKRQMSLLQQQWLLVPENKAARVAMMNTPEYKAAVSAGLERRWEDQAEHVKSSVAQVRRYKLMTPQEKAALILSQSASALLRFEHATAEQRAAWIEAIKTSHQTSESRAICSKSAEARWRNMSLAERTALIEAINIGKRTPQAIINFSKGTKLIWATKTPKQHTAWIAAITKGNRAPKARAKSAESTRAFWATMTPVERSAHYQSTHPNGNGRNKP